MNFRRCCCCSFHFSTHRQLRNFFFHSPRINLPVMKPHALFAKHIQQFHLLLSLANTGIVSTASGHSVMLLPLSGVRAAMSQLLPCSGMALLMVNFPEIEFEKNE